MEKAILELLRQWSNWEQYHYAYGVPSKTSAVLKQSPEDFRVDEVLGFAPKGEGTHFWLQIQKRGLNTLAVVDALARFGNVHAKDIGYSGLKDKNAITTQWLSVPATKNCDWGEFQTEGAKLLQCVPHPKKLARGVHQSNRFEITLRQATGSFEVWAKRFETLGQKGVPNYFGPQRFGINQNNLYAVMDLFDKRRRLTRNKRSLALSTLRSALFNAVCSKRVQTNTWDTLIEGEVAQLQGSQSIFKVEALDEALSARTKAQDIHPTGPMLGMGKPSINGAVEQLEAAFEQHFVNWEGLQRFKLQHARRALRCCLIEPKIKSIDEATLQLNFELPKGAYATSVLRELCQVNAHENITE